MNVSLQKPVEADYVERADKKNRKLMAQLIDDGLDRFDKGIARVNSAGKELVAGCNDIRESGRKFLDAEQINQLEFKNWFSNIADWKNNQIRQMKIKVAKSVAATMLEPGRTLDDCKRALQLVFVAAGQMSKAKRLGQQTQHEPPNIWNDLVDTWSTYQSIFSQLKEREPMNGWTSDRLEKFLMETEPIESDRRMAKSLLGQT